MANQPHHREQVRQKIIQSALHLFNRYGFTAASIDDIMAGAGMTRGGFYSYFQSKSELYAEAISCFVSGKLEGIAAADKASDRAARLVREYLSGQHFEDVETSCPLIGLPNDVSRNDQSVREAQESALRMMLETFEQGIAAASQPARQLAMALTSLCIGGMVLARAIEDRSLADELREATMALALKLGHWS
ncbi:MAG: TetR/AcrR family transcriptional regulator [Bradyrhizobium sp.]|jgi:TetR/AcrR family transcriptional regulator, transcriptional repressor for nem operon